VTRFVTFTYQFQNFLVKVEPAVRKICPPLLKQD
jgi:hypothetical protein